MALAYTKASVTRQEAFVEKVAGTVQSHQQTNLNGKGALLKDASRVTFLKASVRFLSNIIYLFLDCFKNIEGGLAYGESIDGVKVGKASNFK